jgi:hypothetical protein
VKALLLSLALVAACASAQEAPVTRAEFAGLFASIARGYSAAGDSGLPPGFKRDDKPVTREEVAQSLVLIAKQAGRLSGDASDAVAALKRAKLLAEDASFFKDPGKNFRPQDLVKALVAFADGMGGRNKPLGSYQPALTTPKGGGNETH